MANAAHSQIIPLLQHFTSTSDWCTASDTVEIPSRRRRARVRRSARRRTRSATASANENRCGPMYTSSAANERNAGQSARERSMQHTFCCEWCGNFATTTKKLPRYTLSSAPTAHTSATSKRLECTWDDETHNERMLNGFSVGFLRRIPYIRLMLIL